MTASKLGMSIATAVLLAGAAVGQAQQTQQRQNAPRTAAAAASSTAAPASKAIATAPSAAKSSDAQASDSGLSTDQLKEARDDGFKPVTRGKATLYCKSEIIVGSSFPVHTCYNADRLKIVMQQQEAQRMQLQQMHGGGMQSH